MKKCDHCVMRLFNTNISEAELYPRAAASWSIMWLLYIQWEQQWSSKELGLYVSFPSNPQWSLSTPYQTCFHGQLHQKCASAYCHRDLDAGWLVILTALLCAIIVLRSVIFSTFDILVILPRLGLQREPMWQLSCMKVGSIPYTIIICDTTLLGKKCSLSPYI